MPESEDGPGAAREQGGGESEAHPAVPIMPDIPLGRRIGMWPVRFYQLTLSWLLGGQCRFTPSCSRYALEAIERHGVLKGWGLALSRIVRCQPFCKGGYDPVPPLKNSSGSNTRQH